jgi:predicted TIM-barrel fold metal-dependent hydrolase
MSTRRHFLKGAGAAAGVMFCSCGQFNAAHAAQQAPRHLPVMVAGKRIKTVDIHAHCLFQESLDLVSDDVKRIMPQAQTRGAKEHFIVIEERLKAMDNMGIDVEVLSINPIFWYGLERDLAAKVVDIQNAKLAELCAKRPDRLMGFASLALQFPDLAVQQLETAMKKQGLKGAAIGTSVLDQNFSDPKFHPVWAKAEELGAVLFLHPASPPELSKRLQGSGFLINTVGLPLATTIALQHLIFEGTLDKFPGLKVIAAHGGGFLPSYAPRSDYACDVSPVNCTVKLKMKPTEYLKKLYYDALVFTPEALRHVVAQVGATQLMLGTDHPIPWEQHPVDRIFEATSLSNKEKVAILGGNAARVFGME